MSFSLLLSAWMFTGVAAAETPSDACNAITAAVSGAQRIALKNECLAYVKKSESKCKLISPSLAQERVFCALFADQNRVAAGRSSDCGALRRFQKNTFDELTSVDAGKRAAMWRHLGLLEVEADKLLAQRAKVDLPGREAYCRAITQRDAARCLKVSQDREDRKACPHLVRALQLLDGTPPIDIATYESSLADVADVAPVAEGATSGSALSSSMPDTEIVRAPGLTVEDVAPDIAEHIVLPEHRKLVMSMTPEEQYAFVTEVRTTKAVIEAAGRERSQLATVTASPVYESMLDKSFNPSMTDRVLKAVGPDLLVGMVPVVGTVKGVRDDLVGAKVDNARQNTHEYIAEALGDPATMASQYPELSASWADPAAWDEMFPGVPYAPGPSPSMMAALTSLAGHHKVKKWSKRANAAWGVVGLGITAASLGGFEGVTLAGDVAAKHATRLVGEKLVKSAAKSTLKSATGALAGAAADMTVEGGLDSMLSAAKEKQIADSVRTGLKAEISDDLTDGVSEADLARATESVIDYLKARALLAYLGPSAGDMSDPGEAARVSMKASFGSPPTEHLTLETCRPRVGIDNVEIRTVMSMAEFYYYDLVASTRADRKRVPSATEAAAMRTAAVPSPLKMMWHSEKICSTLADTQPSR